MAKRGQHLSEGTYSISDGGTAKPIRVAKPRARKPTDLNTLSPGYYAVDQHRKVIAGPARTKAAAERAGDRSNISYGVLRVEPKKGAQGR